MMTDESKLKGSFAKEIPVNSGTLSNCTVKVPVLIHNSSKASNKPCVYHAKLPKHSSCNSSCTNVKNPWVMWSAVVFAAIAIIIIFASLQGKTSADLKNAKNRVEKLESLVYVLRKDIADLEKRVQCIESDNGMDNRGKPCPAGGGVKTGYLKDKRKGAKTNSSDSPTQKTTSKYQTKPRGDMTSPRVFSQTDSRTTKRRLSTIYTVWGNSTCRDDVINVYSGRVASLHSGSNPSVGSEYMCIPDRLFYTKHENLTSGLYLSPVKYGGNMNIFMKFTEEQCQHFGPVTCNSLKVNQAHLFRKLDYFQVPCVVCQREKRTATLLMPGRNICQSGWWKEYIGFLMTQQNGDARSQHICVIADAQGVPGSNTTGATGPLLQPVAYKCNGPSCPPNDSFSYKPRALSCAVCSI